MTSRSAIERKPMGRKVLLAIPVFIFFAFLTIGQPRQTGTPADAIFYNGHFITMGSDPTTAQAVAVLNGKYVVVGTNDAVQRSAGPKTLKVDLKGRTAVPGLADDHF